MRNLLKWRYLTAALISGALATGFQNCSQAKFSSAADSNVGSLGQSQPGDTPLIPPPNQCTQTCAVPNGVGVQACESPDTCTLTQCNAGFVPQNGMCVPVSTNPAKFTCTSYVRLVLNPTTNQLTLSDGSDIPAQNPSGSGACYYYPIYDGPQVAGSSYLTQDHDSSVVTRDHDVNSGNPKDVFHPYVMKQNQLGFKVQGQRLLELTGGSVSGTSFNVQPISIDNFFLVGVYPKSAAISTANLLSFYSAWGTGDSVIALANGSVTDGIAFNPSGIDLMTNASTNYPDGSTQNYSNSGLVTASDYAIVPLNVEASGGTAQVPAVSLTNLLSPGVDTSFDFRGLDCGSARYLGDIYLLFK